MTEIERLAQAFVEATTSSDYEPLPDAVKGRLCDAAAALIDWREKSVYVIGLASRGVSQHETDSNAD